MPALGAHQDGGVAGPRDLHEHRAVRERLAGGGEGRGRHAGAARLALARGAQHDARAGAPRRRHLAHPPDRDEALDVGRAGVPREQQRAAVELLAQQRGVARVHAGAERLGEQRVAVVPQRDESRARCTGA